MLNRLSALWLVLGAIGGYAVAGPSVTAHSGTSLFNTALNSGNTVRLTFQRDTFGPERSNYVNCTVAEVQGRWVRCKAADSFQEDREQQWYSLERVVQITKKEK